jgi:phosphate transport system substrate-binding protein
MRMAAMGTTTVLAALVVLFVAACGSPGGSGGTGGGGGSSALNGAGGTFPAPLYAKWADEYNKASGVQVNYNAVGSGAGIQAIEGRTVDFGASDAPLSAQELQENGLIQFPLTMGGVVMAVNIDGVADGQLRLDGPTIAKIYLGDIKTWDDPAIKALNPGLSLPSTAITVVHRSDSSGTSFIFTSYLSDVSPQWKSAYGASKEVNWPVGVGAKGNPGVAVAIQQTKGAIGYVEYAYAKQNNMPTAVLRNRDGQWVTPSLASFGDAAAKAAWTVADGFGTVLVNQPGVKTWPITGATFILLAKDQQDTDKARAMLQFFDWCLKNGQATAQSLDYVPIPQNVVPLIEDQWRKDVTVSGTAVWP